MHGTKREEFQVQEKALTKKVPRAVIMRILFRSAESLKFVGHACLFFAKNKCTKREKVVAPFSFCAPELSVDVQCSLTFTIPWLELHFTKSLAAS